MTEEVVEIKVEEPEIKQIENKSIDKLTDDEKRIILENVKNGVENQYYNVRTFKNGNTRITKKKAPTVSEQVVRSNGKREIQGQTVYFTDQQLIWEHLFELERNYAKLYGKHKKMKARYNDLVYEPDERVPERCEVEQKVIREEQTNAKGNWRSKLMNSNFYMN